MDVFAVQPDIRRIEVVNIEFAGQRQFIEPGSQAKILILIGGAIIITARSGGRNDVAQFHIGVAVLRK